jgi:hypothetical protein
MGGAMNAIRNIFVIALTLCLMVFGSSGAYASDISAEDQQIIDAGVEKAKELKVNPIPICEGKDGNQFIPQGFMFNISNGGFALQDGDMLFNVTHKTITAVDVKLERGEYAVIENSQAKKGDGNLKKN